MEEARSTHFGESHGLESGNWPAAHDGEASWKALNSRNTGSVVSETKLFVRLLGDVT